MTHIESLTRYIANFIDELSNQGVHDIVISPGSRSTPLAMLAVENESIRDWVLVDERSASYFALGLAKKTNRPVALICTSGTAAANYYPAVIEAYHGRVPLLVLTADRPHELRDVGAPQAMNQLNLYGDFVKRFYEMSLPEASDSMLHYVRNRAQRAVFYTKTGNPGPVQLNFPIREPLTPDLKLPDLFGKSDMRQQQFVAGKQVLAQEEIDAFIRELESKQQPIIVCGPQTDKHVSELLISLSEQLKIPIIADSLSQIRSTKQSLTYIIDSSDAILKSQAIRKNLVPDMIIRFGAMPISKSFLFYLKENDNVPHYVIEAGNDVREPTNQQAKYLMTDEALFIQSILERKVIINANNWTDKWTRFNELAREALIKENSEMLTEGNTIKVLINQLPPQSELFIANSMAIRDLDTYYQTNHKEIYIYGNRGVSGIDGVVSTALGIAATNTQPVTLVIGDLSFYHDLNGLLAAKHYVIDITIVLINNEGGGIFSFLPQAEEGVHFEKLFGTSLGIDFSHSVFMYGGKYTLIKDQDHLNNALRESYSTPGLKVIEVQTNRDENVKAHRKLWSDIEKTILKEVKNNV